MKHYIGLPEGEYFVTCSAYQVEFIPRGGSQTKPLTGYTQNLVSTVSLQDLYEGMARYKARFERPRECNIMVEVRFGPVYFRCMPFVSKYSVEDTDTWRNHLTSLELEKEKKKEAGLEQAQLLKLAEKYDFQLIPKNCVSTAKNG